MERSTHFYDKEVDEDFVSVNGDYDKALLIKKAKAENNIIKYYLIRKMANNEEFSSDENKYIEKWKESIIKEISVYTPE